MATDFKFDVFLSHSAKDKKVVRPIAERLRSDGVRVWYDEWETKPGDNIPSKIEEGLENSRVLVLCMSANAFGADWPHLESYMFRFRDPLNKDRRFIPLRLDDAAIKGSLVTFSYIDWIATDQEQKYSRLLEACRSPVKRGAEAVEVPCKQRPERAIILEDSGFTRVFAFSPDGNRALTGGGSRTVQLFDVSGVLGGVLGSALRLSIYFIAFFSSIVYSLPLWPDLYDSNMKVQCTT